MAEEVVVRVAELRAARGETVLVTLGLGSCVAIVLHDSATGVGGMAHVLLPSPSLSRSAERSARFPQGAVPALVTAMTELGADPRRLTARLAGGAAMFANLAPSGSLQMGDRNVIAAREVLHRQGIPVVGEAVGGHLGRSVWLYVAGGRLVVRSVGQGEQTL
jgi:chemotaxis protein CheD